MPALQRSISKRGPRFYAHPETGETTFVLHLDGSTQFGPRPATPDDIAEHADAYEAFLTEQADEPLAPLVTFTTPPGTVIPPDVGSVAKPRGRQEA